MNKFILSAFGFLLFINGLLSQSFTVGTDSSGVLTGNTNFLYVNVTNADGTVSIVRNPHGIGVAARPAFTAEVIWEGDSLTTDTSPAAGDGNTWPAFLRTNLLWNGIYRYTNAARGSRTAENIVTQYSTNIQSRWLPDYRSEKGIYFNWSGINDILNGGKSGEVTYSFLQTNWVNAAHDGLKVVAFTVATNLLFGNDATLNGRRVTLNNLIRSNSQLYDILIDIDRLYGNGSSTNTDVFIDGVHYTASNNNYIANFVYTNIGPFQPRYIPYVNGLPTNKYDGFLFGNTFIGNWSGDAALQYIAIGQSAFRTNGLGPAILQGPNGDTVINSGGGNPLRFDLNVVNYALLDTDGRFKSLGGGFDSPGGDFRSVSAIFSNYIAIIAGASSNKVWTCTNSTTGQGEWRTPSGGSLASLSDVSIVSPQQGDLIQYQSGDSKWHNFPAFFQVNYSFTLISNVTINAGTNIEQSFAISSSNSFGLTFNGTPLLGETFNIAVSNYNPTVDIYMTNANSYDTEFGQVVSTYLCPSNAISVFSFVNRTNFNNGTNRWELSSSSRRRRDLLDAITSKSDQFVQTSGGTAAKFAGAIQFTGLGGNILDSGAQNRLSINTLGASVTGTFSTTDSNTFPVFTYFGAPLYMVTSGVTKTLVSFDGGKITFGGDQVSSMPTAYNFAITNTGGAANGLQLIGSAQPALVPYNAGTPPNIGSPGSPFNTNFTKYLRVQQEEQVNTLIITNNIGIIPGTVTGVGGANTNFTFQANDSTSANSIYYINAGTTNVNLVAIMGGSESVIYRGTIILTNRTATSRTFSLGATTNNFISLQKYDGITAPFTITNSLAGRFDYEIKGSNVFYSYKPCDLPTN